MRKPLLSVTVVVCLVVPAVATAQTSRSGLISTTAADRLELTREWFTQVDLDRARGRVSYVDIHVNNSRTHTLFQVVYDRGKIDFSEKSRDRFGNPIGTLGAVELAAEKMIEITRDLKTRDDSGGMKDELIKTEQAAEQVLQNILDFRAKQETSRETIAEPNVEEVAAPLFSRAKASPDELPRFERRIVPEITLYAATDRGVTHAIDGESGKTRWSVPIGRTDHPNMAPAANDDYVAVVNGSVLFIVDSDTGKTVWQRKLEHAPGASPAITTDTVFVPMVSGHMEMYKLFRLDEEFQPPGFFVATGRNLVRPLTTPNGSVCWPTDRGYLYVASGDSQRLRFRLEADKKIESPATFAPPGFILVSSIDGYVYCMRELSGDIIWRFSTGQPISRSAIPIGDAVYIVTDEFGLFRVNLQNGAEQWWSPRIRRFLSASETRVYCEGDRGQIVVLDAQSGGRIGSIDTAGLDLKLLNVETDRLYLGTTTGLIQCLHETQLELPVVHRAREAKQTTKRVRPSATTTPATKPEDGDGKSPFGGGRDPFGGGADPFGGGADPFGGGSAPKDDGGGAVDPFGGADPFGSP